MTLYLWVPYCAQKKFFIGAMLHKIALKEIDDAHQFTSLQILSVSYNFSPLY